MEASPTVPTGVAATKRGLWYKLANVFRAQAATRLLLNLETSLYPQALLWLLNTPKVLVPVTLRSIIVLPPVISLVTPPLTVGRLVLPTAALFGLILQQKLPLTVGFTLNRTFGQSLRKVLVSKRVSAR